MNIKIYQDRRLLNEDNNFGSENENLATTLVFEFPEHIEKDGVQIVTKDLNKTIVFDIEGDNELPIDEDNKFSFPYEITKLGEVVWNICLKEKSETEDMTDKLIWYSETMKSTFIKTNEGHNEITTEKIDVFNSMLTRLNNGIAEVEELKVYIENFKKDVEAGKFNGKDGIDGKDGQDGYSPVKGKDYWTPEDRTEIINEIDNKVQEDLKSYYLKSETYNKEEIDNKISLIPKFDIKVVDKLPTSNISESTVYLVKSGEESQNLYTEYIYTNGKWEQLGTQKLDLSGFYSKDEINSMLATRDSKITALEEENRSQAEKITSLEKENANQAEELETLWKDYKEKEVEGETVAISDGIGKIKDTIYGMSKQNTTEGYNILDFNVTQDKKVTVNKDGTITINGTGGFGISYKDIDLIGGESYSQYIELISGRSFNTSTGAETNNGIMDIISSNYIVYGNKRTVTPNEDVTRNAMWLNQNMTFENARFKIWAYKGTDDKPYEPYTGGQASPNTEYKQDIEVITEVSLVQRGKNYNPNSGVDYVSTSSKIFFLPKGSYIAYLDDNSKFSSAMLYMILYDKVSQAKITNNGHLTNFNFSTSSYNYYAGGDARELKFETDDDYYVTLGFNATKPVTGTELMLEEGTTATGFEPYIEPIVKEIDLAGNSLAKVPNPEVKDNLLIGLDGSVKIGDKVIKRYVFTGDETFGVGTTGSGLKYFNFSGIFNDNGSNSIYMNYFKKISKSYSELTEKGDYCTWATQDITRLAIMCKDYDTVADFKAWIKEKYNSGEPLYMDYVLAEKYRETINLPSIKPIKLIEGITNVFELVTNLGTTMKVEYKVSNNSRLEALEQAFLLKA